jgi:biotin transport system substrate-specific component
MPRNALALTLLPTRSLTRDLGLVTAGAALTAVCAQISLPWQPVPFTLQTLAVTLCGLAMGARLGAMSQVAYIAAGVAGAPVFAEAAAGPAHLFGPTGGYLVAFVLAAGLLGWLADRGWTRSLWLTAAALTIGNALILGLGAAWLGLYVGPAVAVQKGVLPFLSGAVAKSVAVVLSLPLAWRLVKSDEDQTA